MAKDKVEKAAALAEKVEAKAAEAEREAARVKLEAETKAPEVVPEVVPEKKSGQKARWNAFLAAHEKQNPEKHATRLKEGLTMPENF